MPCRGRWKPIVLNGKVTSSSYKMACLSWYPNFFLLLLMTNQQNPVISLRPAGACRFQMSKLWFGEKADETCVSLTEPRWKTPLNGHQRALGFMSNCKFNGAQQPSCLMSWESKSVHFGLSFRFLVVRSCMAEGQLSKWSFVITDPRLRWNVSCSLSSDWLCSLSRWNVWKCGIQLILNSDWFDKQIDILEKHYPIKFVHTYTHKIPLLVWSFITCEVLREVDLHADVSA